MYFVRDTNGNMTRTTTFDMPIIRNAKVASLPIPPEEDDWENSYDEDETITEVIAEPEEAPSTKDMTFSAAVYMMEGKDDPIPDENIISEDKLPVQLKKKVRRRK